MQTIALQRVFMILLLVSHQFGWHGLYPPFVDNDDVSNNNTNNTNTNTNNGYEIVQQLFDDSFVCSILAGIYVTEWYLASVYGWTEKK